MDLRGVTVKIAVPKNKTPIRRKLIKVAASASAPLPKMFLSFSLGGFANGCCGRHFKLTFISCHPQYARSMCLIST